MAVPFQKPASVHQKSLRSNCRCEGFVADAARELQAFAQAVTNLYGREYARPAADDWMEELKLLPWPLGNEEPNWRRISLAASVRLTQRLGRQGAIDGLGRAS